MILLGLLFVGSNGPHPGCCPPQMSATSRLDISAYTQPPMACRYLFLGNRRSCSRSAKHFYPLLLRKNFYERVSNDPTFDPTKILIRFIHKPLQERGAQPGQWKPCTATSAAVALLSFRLGVRPSSRVLRVGTPPRAGAESAPTGGSAPPSARTARNAGRLASSPTGAGMGERGRERG